MTKPYLSMLEGGQRGKPSLAVLKRLARALDVPVTDLLVSSPGREEYWQAEADLDFGPTSIDTHRFETREEAEEEARSKGFAFVAWYRGPAGDKIRRAFPARKR